MKRYLLFLRSSDFVKNNNVWTTGSVNLYNNNSYTNYSYVRSSGGLNLIGDRTYVGTELASPNAAGDEATPVSDSAIYVTNSGEVVYDSATPSILRFIDTSSKIDIISYRHSFTNLPGSHKPGFSIQFYESDSSSGPWMPTVFGADNGTVLSSDVKPYIKIELTLDDQGIDLSSVGLVFYLEVAIHDLVPENTAQSTRQILERFPSWTKIYEDSVIGATPSVDIPVSTGGKFLNALTGTHLDDLQRRLDLQSINSFINSADENMLSWIYASYGIPPNIQSVTGDSVVLAKVANFSDLVNLRPTDYAFYVDNINGQLITNRLFNTLSIDGVPKKQEAINVYNSFDEFGARVGLPRLYLENNSNYKKRILDATQNISGVTKRAFQLALRRELDIWRAYGATPDSNYIGATPEILEIQDIQTSTPYFSEHGHPQQIFKDLIEDINIKYPSNIGYVNWGEGIWDYGGILGQGLSRVPAIYDEMASPIGTYYKPGIGDFDDAKLSFDYEDSATINFNGLVKIEGYQLSDYKDLYAPIDIQYEIGIGYTKQVIEAASPGAPFVYEITLPEDGAVATPAVFYSNFSFAEYPELIHANIYGEGHPASPEYNLVEIFDHDGYTIESIDFRNKLTDALYESFDSTPRSNRIFYSDIETISYVKGFHWEVSGQSYNPIPVADVKYSYSVATPEWSNYSTESSSPIILSSPNFDLEDLDILIGSNIYSTTPQYSISDKIRRSITLNSQSSFSDYDLSALDLEILSEIESILLPGGATSNNIYIDVIKDPIEGSYGGNSIDPVTGDRHFIPSSPNIMYYESATISSVDLVAEQVGDDIWGDAEFDQLGQAADISSDGTIIALGSYYNNSGYVRVFEYNGSSWNQLGSDLVGSGNYDFFGFDVSLSSDGTRLAVGAPEMTSPFGSAGYVKVYDWNGTSWSQVGSTLIPTLGVEAMGYSVAISNDGNSLVVGLPQHVSTGTYNGMVRFYEFTGFDWSLSFSITGDDLSPDFNYFGSKVAISGDGSTIACYSHGTSGAIGHVDIYDLLGSQIGSTIVGDNANDRFGEFGLSLSNDGTYVAIGSMANDDAATNAGLVKVYHYESGDWVQNGSTLYGLNADDMFGGSVHLSTDGTRLTVGAALYGEYNEGAIYFYEYSGSDWLEYVDPVYGDYYRNALDPDGFFYGTNGGLLLPKGVSDDFTTILAVEVNAGEPGTSQEYSGKSYTLAIVGQVAYSYVDSQAYFDSATLNYNNEYQISVKSENGELYPIQSREYETFTAQTTPNLYSGYIDRYGNAYRSDEEAFNSYYNDDKLVGTYYLSLDSFNLSEDSYRVIEKLSFITDNNKVIQYTEDVNGLRDSLQSAILESATTNVSFNIYAELDPYAERDYVSEIHSGLFSVGEKDYYIYSSEKIDQFNSNQDFEVVLSEIPRNGSPVIVKVGEDYYRNVFFDDAATPGVHTFENTEIVYGNEYNLIHLAYQNVYIEYVKDMFTGKEIFIDQNVPGHIAELFSEATPMIKDREYQVRYSVNNSYFLDKDFYDESNDSYYAKLYLSSTPSSPEDYVITYESAQNSETKNIDLRIDSIENPIDEGFVYIDNSEKDFGSADLHLSPGNISDNYNDLMYLTVVSKDVNGNLKPNQSFRVSSSSLSATPWYFTTDDNGIAKSILRYSGSVPSSKKSDYLLIEGLHPATPGYTHEASQTQDFAATVNYNIQAGVDFIASVKAVPARLHYISSNEVYVNITGQIYWRDKPLNAEVELNWYVGGTLYEIFEESNYEYSGSVTTSSDGSFEIANIILTDPQKDPGVNFAVIEISDDNAVRSIVQSLGEVLHDNLITIGGDVVYWHEGYNPVQYGLEMPAMDAAFNHIKEDMSELYSTPNFRYRHSDADIVTYSSASYNWKPPRWIPVDKYDQYQMGILGATPNIISDYTQIHPDSSEY